MHRTYDLIISLPVTVDLALVHHLFLWSPRILFVLLGTLRTFRPGLLQRQTCPLALTGKLISIPLLN